MNKFPFRFRDIELQEILEKQVTLPEHLTEQDFVNCIQNNERLFWMVDFRWLTKKTLPLLLDEDLFKKWQRLKKLHWLIILGVIAFTIWKGEPGILLIFLFYPILTGGFDHSLFIIMVGSLIGLTALFSIHIPYLWFFVLVLIAGYVLNKATAEMAERNIVSKALSDWPTFWRCYSNQVIKIRSPFRNNERFHLIKKIPQLNIDENG